MDLFENLMHLNEAENRLSKSKLNKSNRRLESSRLNKKIKSHKKLNENDETLLNLTIQIPEEIDVDPKDISVDIGAMTVDTSDVEPEDDMINIDDASDDDTDNTSDESDTSDEEDADDEDLDESVKPKDSDCDSDCKKEIKNEALCHLDTSSLNKLITSFVRDNYKNIDKITISKAMLENNKLILKGKIYNLDGKTESIILTNVGFNPVACNNKIFEMDFRDTLNLFNILESGRKTPFLFTCKLQEGVLSFNNLKYDYKTKMNESTTAQVYGNCSLKENNISSNNIILVKDLKLGDKFHYEGDSDEYIVTVNKINKSNNDAIIYGSYSDGEKVKIKLSLNDEVELAQVYGINEALQDFSKVSNDLTSKYKQYTSSIDTKNSENRITFNFKSSDLDKITKMTTDISKDGWKFKKDNSKSKQDTKGMPYKGCWLTYEKLIDSTVITCTIRLDGPKWFISFGVDK